MVHAVDRSLQLRAIGLVDTTGVEPDEVQAIVSGQPASFINLEEPGLGFGDLWLSDIVELDLVLIRKPPVR